MILVRKYKRYYRFNIIKIVIGDTSARLSGLRCRAANGGLGIGSWHQA